MVGGVVAAVEVVKTAATVRRGGVTISKPATVVLSPKPEKGRGQGVISAERGAISLTTARPSSARDAAAEAMKRKAVRLRRIKNPFSRWCCRIRERISWKRQRSWRAWRSSVMLL